MDWYPLWNSLRIAALVPLGCRPTGALIWKARSEVNSVRAKVLPVGKTLERRICGSVEIA